MKRTSALSLGERVARKGRVRGQWSVTLAHCDLTFDVYNDYQLQRGLRNLHFRPNDGSGHAFTRPVI